MLTVTWYNCWYNYYGNYWMILITVGYYCFENYSCAYCRFIFCKFTEDEYSLYSKALIWLEITHLIVINKNWKCLAHKFSSNWTNTLLRRKKQISRALFFKLNFFNWYFFNCNLWPRWLLFVLRKLRIIPTCNHEFWCKKKIRSWCPLLTM